VKQNLNRTQKYKVIALKKKDIFKDVTRGDPWAPSLVKQNLNRTQKYKVIALKKKDIFKDVTRGDPGRPLS